MTQESVLSILKTGANVFLTGAPGAGKTYVLNQYTRFLAECDIPVAITASTGIAATHIGGMTIHSWSGIGIRDTLSPRDLDDIASNERVSKRVRAAKVLVIDEISMLDGRVLDAVDSAIRTVRQKNEPFGGLQVVLVGDFFQLPPIGRKDAPAQFAFKSEAWAALNPVCCYLTEQHRHDDGSLLSMLSAIREAAAEEALFEPLLERMNAAVDFAAVPTRLYTHNSDVDRINDEALKALSNPPYTFTMTGKGNRILQESLKKNCLSPETLVLKEGASVICTKNNFDKGFVNGTLGIITGFDSDSGYPLIETVKGKRLLIEPMEWTIEDNGKTIASITQLPLRLAWAITIHKSQGMTLDAAVIDLSKTFEFGQGYVALSRVRTLSGITLLGINQQAFLVHPEVAEKDIELRELSNAAAEAFSGIPKEEMQKMHEAFIASLGGTIPKEGTKSKIGKSLRAFVKEKKDTRMMTFALLREGNDVTAVAKKRALALTTILGHVHELAMAGKLRSDDIPFLTVGIDLSERDIDVIEAAFKRLDTTKLTPVFDHFNGKYPFESINLVRSIAQIRSKA